MFTAGLLTIAKSWKQPKCPLTEESIKNCTYMQGNITRPLKKNEIMSFAATWLNLEVTILSKDRERQLSYDITRVKSNSKMTQMNLF